MENECEVWKDVVGLENYYKISNFGKVFSKRSDKVVKPALLENGYLRIHTKICGSHVRFRVHRAVAEAFIERGREDQVYVNHIDGDKQNNHYLNLEWCTLSENQIHARLTGLHPKIYEEGHRKLDRDSVKFIRDNHTKGCPKYGVVGLSKMFGMCTASIVRLLKGITYKDVV